MNGSEEINEDQALIDSDPKANLWALVFANIKRTIPTALSYDFSLGLPIIGAMMTHAGEGKAAPVTTMAINTVGFLMFATILPSSFELGRLKGELEELEKISLTEPNAQLNTIDEIKNAIIRTPKNAIIASQIGTGAICVFVFSAPILSLLGQRPEIANTAQDFLRYYAPFFLVFTPRLAMEFVLLTHKNQNWAMGIADSALIVTFVAQYLFGFQVPHLKAVTGLAIGSGLGMVLTFSGFTARVLALFGPREFCSHFFSWEANDIKQIKGFLTNALPIMFNLVCEVSTGFALSLIAGTLPGDAIEKQNVATVYLTLNTVLVAASGQTASLMVSEALGRLKANSALVHEVQLAGAAGNLANFTVQILPALFVTVFPMPFAYIIGAPQSLNINELRNLLMLTVLFTLIDGFRYNMLQIARALGANLLPSLTSSGAVWLGVGLAYVLSKDTSLGVLGLPVGLATGAAIGAAALIPQASKALQEKMPYRTNAQNSLLFFCSCGNDANTHSETPVVVGETLQY